MEAAEKAARFAQLQALRANDPMRLITMYCSITDQPVTSQLPAHASFAAMIDVILDHDMPTGQVDRVADEATR